MMHFKKCRKIATKGRGFTLVEVLFSLAISALMLGPLYILQADTLRNVINSDDHLMRVLIAKTFWTGIAFQGSNDDEKEKEPKKKEKNIESPETTVMYERLPIEKKSSLAECDGLQYEKVTFSWRSIRGKEMKDQLIGLVWEPEQQ